MFMLQITQCEYISYTLTYRVSGKMHDLLTMV